MPPPSASPTASSAPPTAPPMPPDSPSSPASEFPSSEPPSLASPNSSPPVSPRQYPVSPVPAVSRAGSCRIAAIGSSRVGTAAAGPAIAGHIAGITGPSSSPPLASLGVPASPSMPTRAPPLPSPRGSTLPPLGAAPLRALAERASTALPVPVAAAGLPPDACGCSRCRCDYRGRAGKDRRDADRRRELRRPPAPPELAQPPGPPESAPASARRSEHMALQRTARSRARCSSAPASDRLVACDGHCLARRLDGRRRRLRCRPHGIGRGLHQRHDRPCAAASIRPRARSLPPQASAIGVSLGRTCATCGATSAGSRQSPSSSSAPPASAKTEAAPARIDMTLSRRPGEAVRCGGRNAATGGQIGALNGRLAAGRQQIGERSTVSERVRLLGRCALGTGRSLARRGVGGRLLRDRGLRACKRIGVRRACLRLPLALRLPAGERARDLLGRSFAQIECGKIMGRRSARLGLIGHVASPSERAASRAPHDSLLQLRDGASFP